MQDSSIQNARIHTETTVNYVDFRHVASCILNLQCRADPCDQILFNPIRYHFPSGTARTESASKQGMSNRPFLRSMLMSAGVTSPSRKTETLPAPSAR